jgi:hypothetical protein
MNHLINTLLLGYPAWQWIVVFLMFDVLCVPSMWSIKSSLRDIASALEKRRP